MLGLRSVGWQVGSAPPKRPVPNSPLVASWWGVARPPGMLVDDGCVIGDRWGVSDEEIVRAYPCDDFVTSPTLQAWRGVSIEAPAEAVWPWGAQGRLAPCSFDWVDKPRRPPPPRAVRISQPPGGGKVTP